MIANVPDPLRAPAGRVRADSERLRSRRLDRSHPAVAAAAGTLHARGARFHASIRDLAPRGAALLLPATSLPALPIGETVAVTIAVGNLTVFAGDGHVRHVTPDGDTDRLGIELAGAVPMDALHRIGDDLVIASAWHTIMRRHPGSMPPTVAELLHQWADCLQDVQDEAAALEAAVAAQDLPRRQARREAILRGWGPGFEAIARQYRRALAEAIAADPSALDSIPKPTLKRAQQLYRSCPFADRAFTKPLGYAGDYELMQILYRDAPEARTVLGDLLLRFHRSEPGGVAVRNRVPYLGAAIQDAAARRSRSPEARGPFSIASIGCGAAVELAHLLQHADCPACMRILLVDQDANAMTTAERRLQPLAAAPGCVLDYCVEPVARLMHASALVPALGSRDLIYSAGLFDYLDDAEFVALATALRSALTDGGTLLIGNMATHNPSRVLMTTFMAWDLIHRTAAELGALGAAAARPGDRIAVEAEPAGINLFLRIDAPGPHRR